MCDINAKRVEVAKEMAGSAAPTFVDFDTMIERTKPDAVLATNTSSIPIMKLAERGRLNEDLIRIIRANVRVPQTVLGDVYAMIAANEVGGKKLLEMMERGILVDKASSDQMLQIMRGQLYRTRIPRLLTGYRIPHKTGDGNLRY